MFNNSVNNIFSNISSPFSQASNLVYGVMNNRYVKLVSKYTVLVGMPCIEIFKVIQNKDEERIIWKYLYKKENTYIFNKIFPIIVKATAYACLPKNHVFFSLLKYKAIYEIKRNIMNGKYEGKKPIPIEIMLNIFNDMIEKIDDLQIPNGSEITYLFFQAKKYKRHKENLFWITYEIGNHAINLNSYIVNFNHKLVKLMIYSLESSFIKRIQLEEGNNHHTTKNQINLNANNHQSEPFENLSHIFSQWLKDSDHSFDCIEKPINQSGENLSHPSTNNQNMNTYKDTIEEFKERLPRPIKEWLKENYSNLKVDYPNLFDSKGEPLMSALNKKIGGLYDNYVNEKNELVMSFLPESRPLQPPIDLSSPSQTMSVPISQTVEFAKGETEEEVKLAPNRLVFNNRRLLRHVLREK